MPCHLSKIQGLRWQGGSLERGCLAHREIAGYRLLHRGHPLIAIFTHPLNVSITSMLKPMNTRKIAFSTPSQTPHGDLGRKEGSLELGVYGQKDFYCSITSNNLSYAVQGGLREFSLNFLALKHLLLFLGITQQSTSH